MIHFRRRVAAEVADLTHELFVSPSSANASSIETTGIETVKLGSSARPESSSSSEIADRRGLEAVHASSETRTPTARSRPLMCATNPVERILALRVPLGDTSAKRSGNQRKSMSTPA